HIKGRMQLTTFNDVNPINVFLSTRYGSGYDWEENWFAVSSHSSTMKNTMVAMHEIMHIFFHKQWWNFCKEKGLSDRTIWDVKEAATVLINLWFKNQLIDLDLGYEEHTDLRKQIKQDFLKSRDFKYTIEKACVYMRVNKEKSPTWM
ncbi:MAG: hypothetical protein NTW60_01485, partial [Candidatus Wolfebacteria bacterium]|nr:hypothetical protein [Candidatus Wolfebacteria bacterium]